MTSQVDINIPSRIPRGPTDILKALEKTVSYDPTGPSYRYFDDPHLVPYQERQARMFTLAKNAGRKAARWVRDEHPELFTQVISDPPVMSYMPSAPINAETVNENMLYQKICDTKVTDAIKVYETMQENNLAVADDIKLALLELLCFYNCEDPIPMENEADRFFGQRAVRKDLYINSWKNHPLVQTLFNDLQHLGSAPYCALICGMFNAGAKAEGDRLLAEAKEKKIKLDVNVYNSTITRLISVYEKPEIKLEMIYEILREMNAAAIKPNLSTLNAVIDTISRILFPEKFSVIIKTVAEFERLGIKPSLGTYAYIARGCLGRTKPTANLKPFLTTVLNSLRGQSLEPQHAADAAFFDWMMKGCVVCESLPLATECLQLFLHARNRKLSDGYKTSTFFNNFFHVLSLQGDYKDMVKYYRLLVPHAHTVNAMFYKVLFEACDANAAISDFPGYWRDYMGTGAFHEETISTMLEVAVNLTGLPDPEVQKIRPVIGSLASNFILFKIEYEKDRVFERVPLSSDMCNNILILLARGHQWRSLQTGLKFMSDKVMLPQENTITQIVDSCNDHNNPNMAVWVLKYCHSTFENKLQLKPVVATLMKSDFLNDDMKKDLKETFNDDYSSSSSSGSSESDSSDSSDSDSDSSDSEEIAVPRKKKPEVPKPDIVQIIKDKAI